MVKEKPNSTRIYDDEGFRRRASCICVKSEPASEILLVSSSRNLDQWIVPGGGLEPEESTSVAAIREVKEEAGVTGKLDRCLGIFENPERRHRTVVYVLVVTEELPEFDEAKNMGRKRKWFSIEDAWEHLAANKPFQLKYLERLREESNTMSTIIMAGNLSDVNASSNGTSSSAVPHPPT